MKKLLLFCCFFIFSEALISQVKFDSDSTFLTFIEPIDIDQDYIFFGKTDSLFISLQNEPLSEKKWRKTKTVLSVNNVRVDSLNFRLNLKDLIIQDKPLIILSLLESDTISYFKLDLSEYRFSKFDFHNKYEIFSYFKNKLVLGVLNTPKYFGIGEYVTVLESYDLISNKFSDLLKFENDINSGEGITDVIVFSNRNTLIKFRSCYNTFIECESPKLYHFDIMENHLTQISNDSISLRGANRLYFPTIDGNAFLQNEYGNLFLINKDLKEFNSLNRFKNLIGWNYKDGRQVSYNYISELDKKKYVRGNTYNKVIVPYKLTLGLEDSFYRIYYDQKLDKEIVKGFGLYEWSILKNFLFAKHNYGFSKPFYQAYFNLFEFYRNKEMRENRTKDVNDKLTETDKQN